jgi:hypothetical protein
MGGGVLLVVLAVLWAVVLIPMLLTRHDNTDETKQVARFRRAMTSLSRGDKDVDPLRLRRNQAARVAASRRRRITFAMLFVVFATTAAAAFGYCPVPVVALTYIVLVGWLALAVLAATRMSRTTAVPVATRPVTAAPRTRYVTPTHTWAATTAEAQFYDDDVEQVVGEEYLEATGTDGGSWAPVPHQAPHNVRASGVSGDVIARASSWSKAVLDDVRARTSAPKGDEYHVPLQEPAVSPAAPAPATPAPAASVYLEEEPPTAEIPIIRHAAGA